MAGAGDPACTPAIASRLQPAQAAKILFIDSIGVIDFMVLVVLIDFIDFIFFIDAGLSLVMNRPRAAAALLLEIRSRV